MATDTAKVLETLGKMTVLELVELKKAIEEEWGVTAAAPVAVAGVAAPAAGGDGAAAVEEKSEFDVVLTGAGDKKISSTGRPTPSRRASLRRRPTRSSRSSRRPAPPSS
jgi:ribosomal protein L7/L12